MIGEHGGDLDRAIAQYGGIRDEWLDLSTGINPDSYPVAEIGQRSWKALPDAADINALIDAAKQAYNTSRDCLPLAGAQQAIQLYPSLLARKFQGRHAYILSPSYNEHEIQLRRHGWQVESVTDIQQMKGADLAVVVNPNNPDGQSFSVEALLELSETVKCLVVDESFCDATPAHSLCPHLQPNTQPILVLRSFGKFYGLAGLRLGFAIGPDYLLEGLAEMAGNWAVSGPALMIGQQALLDIKWAETTRAKLAVQSARLDKLAITAGWQLLGGSSLFRLYQPAGTHGMAANWQEHFARHHIWTRRFSYAPQWLRLGLPGAQEWQRLERAFLG